jgi:hypothetical protein
MRPVAYRTIAQQLWAARDQGREVRLPLLRLLAETRHPVATVWVLEAALSAADIEPAEALQLILPFVERWSAPALLLLESARLEQRPWSGRYWPPLWDRVAGEYLDKPGGWAAAAIASLAYDGYVREKATRRLAEMQHDGRETSFLVLRTTDHVREVRTAAAAAVNARFDALGAPGLVASLPLISLLQKRSRFPPAIPAWITRFLCSPEGEPALESGLRSDTRDVRRASFALALQARPETMAERALRDPDPITRLRGARSAQPPALIAATSDPSAPVRIAAFERLVEAPDRVALRPTFIRGLLDRSGSIRAIARHWLSRSGPFDAATFYREAVARRESLSEAIQGLAETGQPDDAAELVLLTDHPRAAIRERATRGIARLLGAEALDALVAMLNDPTERVARAAALLLHRRASAALCQRIWPLVPGSPPKRTARLLWLLDTAPGWEGLEFLLRAVAEPGHVGAQAAALLSKRSSRASWRLHADQAAVLRARVAAVPAGLLSPELLQWLDFEIRTSV